MNKIDFDKETKIMLLNAFKRGYFNEKDIDLLKEKGFIGEHRNITVEKIIIENEGCETFVLDKSCF